MTHPKLDARGNFEVITAERQRAEPGKVIVTALAGLFFLICTWTSYVRWANFQYRSFDLAYYVQAIWQLIHGRLDVSVENVPLLGNHVEPIVFLFAPLFAVFRHPMLFVAVQNAALATMPLVGYNIAKRLGLDGKRACLLSAALLLAPAAGYIAIHKFHPEALVARKTPVGGQSSPDDEPGVFSISGTRLISIATAGEVVSRFHPLAVQLRWKFQGERDVLPWMLLRLSRDENAEVALLVKGLCS
jgi:hypothetical protein